MNDTAPLGRTCLKCGHVRLQGDGGPPEACPACGAIYAKVEAVHATRAVSGRDAARTELPEAFLDEDRRRLTHLVYMLFLLPTGLSQLLGYFIARTAADAHDDEIAYAHGDWQLKTASRALYPAIVVLLLLLVIGGAEASYRLIHDDAMLRLSATASNLLLPVAGLAYIWIAFRSVRGWMHLFRGEGP